MGDSAYEVSWLSKLFHAFPHVDLTFQHVNSSFQPEDARYRESLVFWAAVPVLWLLVTLLVFLMYFCYRCCQRDVEKKQRVPCLKWSMAVLALCTCAFVGIGFYGNEEVREATSQFKSIVEDSEDTVRKVQRESGHLKNSVDLDIDGGLKSLKEIFHRYGFNATAEQALDDLVDECIYHAVAVAEEIATIEMREDLGRTDILMDKTGTYGFYRWLATLLFLIWMVLLCLLLLFGIARSSKCTLLIFCAFGIFTLVVCWMSAGLHTASAMGVADFCVDPDSYIESRYKEPQQRVIVDYYIKCQSAFGGNLYLESVQRATEHLRQVNDTLKRTLELSERLHLPRNQIQHYLDIILEGMDVSTDILIRLTALVECTNLHKDYVHALEVVCDMGLPGLVFLLLSCMLCGLFFTILVILASRAWRHFSRSVYTEREEATPKGYLEVEEDDPFLPRGDNSTSYYSFTRSGRPPGGGASSNREPMSTQRRPTPPPAYNSYDYRSPTEVHHMPDSPANHGAPLASQDDYPTFRRESAA